ncbi:MAG: A24 family peptidase [Methylococcaceae bacterium]|nr:A24 family peptidase [Methylococcaceae bacterium]
MTLDNVPTAVLLAVLIAAAVIDTRRHRLPNTLTVTAALLGLGLQTGFQGVSGLLNGLAGFFTGLVLFLPFYALRWMGAGDVKLMAAVGSFLGWPDSLLAVGLSTGAGSLAAFGLLAARGGLLDYLRRYGGMAKCLFLTGGCAYVPPKAGEASTRVFPYALAIGLGSLATLVWNGRLAPFLEILGSFVHV